MLLSLSTPLGIEELTARQAMPLLAAWHEDPLPQRYRRWATVCWDGLDLPALLARLDAGFVGLQISANRLATPQAVEAVAPVLRVCEAAGRPVFVHPGPVASGADGQSTPLWWPAVVDYTAQLQAAWWAWHVAGRALLPHLRICFAAGAGLAPLQHERMASRGGSLGPIDPNVFVDTSSYGRQGIDALTRVLGIDTLVLGSDRPYGRAFDNPTQVGTTTSTSAGLGDAARVAITTINPVRLLQGGPP